MTRNMPIDIVPVVTGRADDGLALSSRNGYLSADERAEAPRLYRNLRQMHDAPAAGSNQYADLEAAARTDLGNPRLAGGLYRSARRPHAGHRPRRRTPAGGAGCRARLGQTRLIDNIEVQR